MPANVLTRGRVSPFRTILRILFWGLLVLVLAIPFLVVETTPRVVAPSPPTPKTAALTRTLAQNFRDFVSKGSDAAALTISGDEIEAASRTLYRLAPHIRTNAEFGAQSVGLEMSANLPALSDGIWLNAQVSVDQSDNGLQLGSAKIGRLPMPAALVLPLVEIGLDWKYGSGFGNRLTGLVSGVIIEPESITVETGLSGEQRELTIANLRDVVRGAAGTNDLQTAYEHLWWFNKSGDDGRLPQRGSVVPYLRHILEISLETSSDGDESQMRGALLALGIYCGDRTLGVVLGIGPDSGALKSESHCRRTTLGGRDDLKRHFLVSGGIEAARSGGVALGVGEMKELLDSNSGGSGFSFDDLAANVAGIRFAQILLPASLEQQRLLLSRLESEEDILPSLDGLPTGLSSAEFQAGYGDIGDAKYQALLDEINLRIDSLPLYQDVSGL